jgi:hypothetical protein
MPGVCLFGSVTASHSAEEKGNWARWQNIHMEYAVKSEFAQIFQITHDLGMAEKHPREIHVRA